MPNYKNDLINILEMLWNIEKDLNLISYNETEKKLYYIIAWKISKSPFCKKVFVAPGNSGTAMIATNLQIDVNDFQGIKKAVLFNKIDMVVVGPEDPLVNGIHDFFLNDRLLQNVSVIGPQKAAAELEGSKEFAKKFLFKHNIPTAAYKSFRPEELE